MLTVLDLDPEAVARMIQADISSVAEPDGPIEDFSFHGCTGGVAAFRGRPPWEFHGGGDELLFILAGESELTVLDDGGRTVRTLRPGQLVIVPQRRWHSNNVTGHAAGTVVGKTLDVIVPADYRASMNAAG